MSEHALDINTVPVKVVDPVDARIAPTEAGAAFSEELGTDVQRVLQDHPNRRRCLLLASDNDVIWSFSRAQVQKGNGFLLPTGVPVEVTCVNEIYAASSTGTATLSILDEYWVAIDG